jgi:ribosomal protein L24
VEFLNYSRATDAPGGENMEGYSFSDLSVGDLVLIRSGKKRGQRGTVKAITIKYYLLKLESGQVFPVKYGTMLVPVEKNVHSRTPR